LVANVALWALSNINPLIVEFIPTLGAEKTLKSIRKLVHPLPPLVLTTEGTETALITGLDVRDVVFNLKDGPHVCIDVVLPNFFIKGVSILATKEESQPIGLNGLFKVIREVIKLTTKAERSLFEGFESELRYTWVHLLVTIL
jgi:hypothetical protein